MGSITPNQNPLCHTIGLTIAPRFQARRIFSTASIARQSTSLRRSIPGRRPAEKREANVNDSEMMGCNLTRNITESGFALISQYRPNADIVDVANEFGDPLTPWEGGLVQTLVPREKSAPNTYSGNYGLGRFPFHTDLAHWPRPPRYLLLRCLIGYDDVPTLLIDGRALVDAISRDTLARAIFKPRRPRDGSVALIRLLERTSEGTDLLRWDEIFLRPASKVGDATAPQIRDWIAKCAPLSVALIRRGDTLIIDNWRMLHARSPIPLGREGRSIERVYLGALH